MSCQFQASELDTPGIYDRETEMTYVDGPETAPTSGYFKVVVEQKL